MRSPYERTIVAAKEEGMKYSDMDVLVLHEANVNTALIILRQLGYRIFFVLKPDFVIDDIAGFDGRLRQ